MGTELTTGPTIAGCLASKTHNHYTINYPQDGSINAVCHVCGIEFTDPTEIKHLLDKIANYHLDPSPWQPATGPLEDGWYWWRKDMDTEPNKTPIHWTNTLPLEDERNWITKQEPKYKRLMSGLWAPARPPA